MLIYQVFLVAFALSIPIAGLVVAVRLIWCAYQSFRARHIAFAAISVLAIACLAGLFAAVLVVWFGYGVAHSKKDIWTDLTVVGLTGLPFYATSFALWRLAKYFQSVVRRRAAQPGAAADAPQAVRR